MNHTQTPATESLYTPDLEAEDDEFERKDFARRIAKTVLDQPLSHSSLVVSIVGPWGSGKSTVLKYIRDELAKEPCKIAPFNPWRYAGEDALLFHLFEALVQAIDPELSILSTWQQMKRAAAKWARPIKAGSKILAWASNAKAPGSGEAISTVASALPEEFKVRMEDIREQVYEYLAGSDKRIIMPIDDVDRLDPHEILTLFRALKLIADLPNTTFIIAMDEEHVSQVIGKHIDGTPETGRRYIEKIVNVRLSLPLIPPDTFEHYTLTRVSKVWINAKGGMPSEAGQYTGQIFRKLHLPFIETPRKAKSIENAFAFSLGLLPQDVAPGDILLLEATRLLHPLLYQNLAKIIPRLHRVESRLEIEHFFNSDAHKESLKDKKTEAIQQLLTCIKDASDFSKEDVEEALKDWFPQLRFEADENTQQKWESDMRICSMEYFWRYFSGTMSRSDVHNGRVANWVALSKQDLPRAVEELHGHFASPYARTFVKKVKTLCTPGKSDCLSTLCALAEAAPPYLGGSEETMFQSLGGDVAQMITTHFLQEPDYNKRMFLGVSVLEAGKDVRWSFALSTYIPNSALRKDPSKEPTINDFRKSPFDEKLAQQSLQAYEDGQPPVTVEMIRDMVWAISRNRKMPGIKNRVKKLIKAKPELGLHFLAVGCGTQTSSREISWIWNGEEGLDKLEKLLSRSIIKQIAKSVASQPKIENRNHRDLNIYVTLEEVAWACLQSIQKRDANKKNFAKSQAK